MAIYTKGILGGFSGKVGPVVGSSWRGKAYMRSKSDRKSGVASQAQLLQQQKFGKTVGVLRSLKPLLNETFGSQGQQSGYALAMSYHLKNAVMVQNGVAEFDFSKMRISSGTLPNAAMTQAPVLNNNQLVLHWHNNSGLGNAVATDKSLVVLYCSDLLQGVYFQSDATRSMQTQSIEVAMFKGYKIHVYQAFVSAEGKLLSNSNYLGQLMVV